MKILRNGSGNMIIRETPPSAAATIDEALEKTHFGRFNLQVIIFSGLILNNVTLESVGISFALPIVACDLNLSYQQQGVLGAVCFLGIIISSHFWGFLADTRGRKRIMRPALFMGFLVTFMSSFSINFIMMAVLRFFNGIFVSAGSATIFAYLGEFHCQKYRNRAILYGSLISAISAIFLPIIAWFFINQDWQLKIPFLAIVYKPWRLYFVICGVSGFCCCIILEYLPESPKYLLGVDKSTESLEILKYMHRKNIKGNGKLKNDAFKITTLLPDLDTPIRKLNSVSNQKSFLSLFKLVWDQTAPLFMREHIRKTFLAGLIQFTIFFTAHGVYMWFPHILNNITLYMESNTEPRRLCDILRLTQSSNFSIANSINDDEDDKICITQLEISTYTHTLVFELIYVSLMVGLILFSMKFDRSPSIIFIILASCGLCGILSLVINIPIIAIYMFVLLLCSGLGKSVINAIVVDIYPTNLRAMAVCISLMFGRIGSVTGSNVLGAYIETNCEEALYSSSIALILAGCLGFLMPRTQFNQK